MRILLINPSQSTVYGMPMPQSHPPLGLLYIGAVLEAQGHDVKVIDEDVDQVRGAALSASVTHIRPDVVGITSTTPVFPHAARLARLVKAASNSTTVLGGIHATIAADEAIRTDGIDVVVRGEGESSSAMLINALEKGQALDGLHGISFKRNGQIIHNPDR